MITENSILNSRYQLAKKIGQGGFAQVFLGTDLLLERRVAVKVLFPELTADETFLERFGREAKAIAGFDHSNILTVFDFGQAEGSAFLVMPYVEGGTLYEKFRQQGSFSLSEIDHYLQQVAAALDYAHRRNVVHRDVKPHNILVRAEDDRLLLADFGIAKVLSATSAEHSTKAMGTISYMAPEQFTGLVVRQTDIYALGCVLFQLLSGRLPYSGTAQQVMAGHITQPIPALPFVENARPLPALLQPIINCALAKNPVDRYQTAGELARAFQAAINSQNKAGKPDEPLETTRVLDIPPRLSQTPTVPPGATPGAAGYGNTDPAAPDEPPATTPLTPSSLAARPITVQMNTTPLTPATGQLPNLKVPTKGRLIVGIAVGLVILLAVGILFASLANGTPTNSPGANLAAIPTITPTTEIATMAVTATPPLATVAPTATSAPATTLAPTITPVPTTAPPTSAAPTVTEAASGGALSVADTTTVAVGDAPGVAPVVTPSFPLAPTIAVVPTPTPVRTAAPVVPTLAPAVATVAPALSNPNQGASFNRAAIDAALASLPGTTSAVVLFPNGQTVEDDATRQLPSASTIKLWIAGAFLDEAKNGRVNLAETYTVKGSDIVQGTGILRDKVGQTYSYGDILSTMLIYSDNSGANILLDRMGGGYDKVNGYIQRNGYGQTIMQRRLGDLANPKNNFTSARDASLYMQRLLRGQIVDQASSNRILKALQDRLAYPDDQNFFGKRLGGLTYRHISGVSPGIRNEVGFFYIRPDTPVIVAFYTSEVGNEAAAENTIATAVQQVSQAAK